MLLVMSLLVMAPVLLISMLAISQVRMAMPMLPITCLPILAIYQYRIYQWPTMLLSMATYLWPVTLPIKIVTQFPQIIYLPSWQITLLTLAKSMAQD